MHAYLAPEPEFFPMGYGAQDKFQRACLDPLTDDEKNERGCCLMREKKKNKISIKMFRFRYLWDVQMNDKYGVGEQHIENAIICSSLRMPREHE